MRRGAWLKRCAAGALLPALLLELLLCLTGCEAPPPFAAAKAPDAAGEKAPVRSAAAAQTAEKFALYTYDDLLGDIALLREAWPELVSPGVLGYSAEGREIPFFLLGKGKREVLLCASMHAREYVCTNVLMYLAECYCQCYADGEPIAGLDVRELLDGVRFVVVPMLNPDGVILAQGGPACAEGKPAEKMPVTDAAASGVYAWKANLNGVDLNGNWPLRWGKGLSSVPASAGYPGPAPLSEPESVAMWKLLEGGSYCSFCSLHTAGECVYWIDDENSFSLRERFYPLARRLADALDYRLLAPESARRSRGCMVNYARERYELFSVTVELCPAIRSYPFTDYDSLRETAERVLPLGLLLAEDALLQPEPEGAVDLWLDGRRLAFPGPRPRLVSGSAAAPLETLCAACGLDCRPEPDRPAVAVSDGKRRAVLAEGSGRLLTDRGEVALSFPVYVENGAFCVPVRELLEYFGYKISWERDTGVLLESPGS